MSIAPGKLLGAYRMLDVVGEGSFGQVWKARKVGALQTVAIKLIPKAGKKEKEIRGLRQEIDILKTLRHENIIQMLDAFETPSDFCVVTEFAQGELFEILESDTSLSEEVVQAIAKQLVAALHYLHSNRIIHRDMKPQNILIAADGSVKLCDFGFARAMSQDTVVLTSIKGTPLYMAPELVQEQPYTPAVDVWSMGVILYELFVGKPPFYTTSIYKLIKQIVNEAPSYPPAMSRNFKSFLQGVLEKDPKKRLGWPDLLQHPFVCDAALQPDYESTLEASPTPKPPNSTPSSRSARSAPSGRLPSRGNPPGINPGDALATDAGRSSSATVTPFATTSPPPDIKRTSPISTMGTATHNKMHEPTFLDPPQFSPQGSQSPSSGPMGSAITERISSGPIPPQRPPVIALLVDAERRVQRGIEEPHQIVADPTTLEAITSALTPPSNGRGLTAWCKLQETQHVVMLIDKILSKIPEGAWVQEIEPSGQLTSVLVLLAKAGQLCVGTSPQFAAAVAAALRKCNDWIICLETFSLCSELVSSRGSWDVAIEGFEGIRPWTTRAQCELMSPGPSVSSRRTAKELIERLIAKKLPGRICRCVEDYGSATGGHVRAGDKFNVAALKALASMLPCVHDSVTGCTCQFRQLSNVSQLSEVPTMWKMVARYILESKETVSCLVRAIHMGPFTTMAIRLLRLEPRLGRHLLLNGIPDSILDNTRRDAAALLGKEIFDAVASTCASSDIVFLERECGARLSLSVNREWIPSLSSGGPDLAVSLAACGAIASYTLLFNSHWSASSLYSHMNGLKGKLGDVRSICNGFSSAAGARNTCVRGSSSWMASSEGIPSTTGVHDGAFNLAYAVTMLDYRQAANSGLIGAAMEAVIRYATCFLRSNGPNLNGNRHASGARDQSDHLLLSPVGVASCLQTIQVGAENDPGTLQRMVACDGLANALIAFLSPEFDEHLATFYGPGDQRVAKYRDISNISVLAIIQAPWVHAPMLCHDSEAISKVFNRQLMSVTGVLSDENADQGPSRGMALISHVVGILRRAKREDTALILGGTANAAAANANSTLPLCAAVLARMALAFGDEAVVMFARSGGLDSAVLQNLLSDRNPDAMLGSSLLVVSQLARTATSKSQIERFIEAGVMRLIPPLLGRTSSSGVRARACNLLGNLCRQSDAPYPYIRDLRILPPLMELCTDEDRSTRKFACFAIGNAGFHSDFLYEDLRPAVRTLVHLLQDDEDRTVANAAGALGNLVRNSGELVPEMLSCGAVGALLAIVSRSDSASTTSTAFQIALFSLGNLAAHRECHATFEDLGVPGVMTAIQRDSSMSKSASKYASRVLAKILNGRDECGDNPGSTERVTQQTPYVPFKSRTRTAKTNDVG